jgi:hypothetical protein
MFLHCLRRSSRLRINLAGKAHLATEIRDWGGAVGIYFRGGEGISRGKACFPRENELFPTYHVPYSSRNSGCVFFLRVGSGHFLESYAVF